MLLRIQTFPPNSLAHLLLSPQYSLCPISSVKTEDHEVQLVALSIQYQEYKSVYLITRFSAFIYIMLHHHNYVQYQ